MPTLPAAIGRAAARHPGCHTAVLTRRPGGSSAVGGWQAPADEASTLTPSAVSSAACSPGMLASMVASSACRSATWAHNPRGQCEF